MFCSQCGGQVANDARFCSSCGTAVAAPAQPIAAAPPPPVQPSPQKQRAQKGQIVQLTQEERENLVFQDGDFYEVLAGVLSISSQHEGKHPNSAATVMQITFFFESSDPNWGTQEWMTTFGGSIPEGPALLVLYRRGNHGNAFGIVSMANRAWTHIVPILGAPLIQDSHKAGELKKLEVKSLGGVVGGAIAAAAVSRLTFGIGQKKMTEKFAGKMGHGNYREAAEKIEATVRSFMFRIAKDAESYWEDGGNSMSGRL